MILACNHIFKSFGETTILKDASFHINEGERVAMVGINGAGKTTMLRIIMGEYDADEGEVIHGKNTTIGYLPQQTAAQKDFPATVQEVVLSGTLSRRGNRPFYSRAERKLAAHNLERLGIEHLKQKCYRELSGGQQQRVLIARALCATEQLLILDEPITGLDPSAIQDFYHLIKKLNKEDGITIIMVSHDIGNVISQANKILHLHRRVVFCGTAEAYRQSVAGKEFLGGDEV